MPETWTEFWNMAPPALILFACAMGCGWLSGRLTRGSRRAAEDRLKHRSLNDQA